MGYQRIAIDEGRLLVWCRGAFAGGCDLEYPLSDGRTGEPAPADYRYRGDAFVEAGALAIESPSAYGRGYGGIREWRIADRPTPESAAYYAGWLYAEGQKRRREPPESKGPRFSRGWRDCWTARREATAS